MTIVRILRVLGFGVLDLVLTGAISFGIPLFGTLVISRIRKGKPLPDSYYDGIPRVILGLMIVSFGLLAVFGPFKII